MKATTGRDLGHTEEREKCFSEELKKAHRTVTPRLYRKILNRMLEKLDVSWLNSRLSDYLKNAENLVSLKEERFLLYSAVRDAILLPR
jgi:hypothetical protein